MLPDETDEGPREDGLGLGLSRCQALGGTADEEVFSAHGVEEDVDVEGREAAVGVGGCYGAGEGCLCGLIGEG